MKAVHFALTASLLMSNLALAQQTDYNALKESSQADAQHAAIAQGQQIANLVSEIDALNLQIENLKTGIRRYKIEGTVGLVVTAGLAALTGLAIHHTSFTADGPMGPTAAKAIMQAGTVLVGAVTAGSAAVSGADLYEVRLESKDLTKLQARLASAKAKLEQKNIQLQTNQ